MATINYDDGAVKTIGTAGLSTVVLGHGRSGPPLFSARGRAQKVVTGKLNFDNSYPTGGEDVSDIWELFANDALEGLLVEDPLLSAGTGKRTLVDYTNKKVKLLDNAVAIAEVANASDQSGAANLRFIAWGPA
jgi:hypothetical protein